MKKRRAILTLTGLVAFGAALLFGTPTTYAATFNPQSFLGSYTPGSNHEALPHGVPSGYDWYSRATTNMQRTPSNGANYLNLWSTMMVDQSNIRPSNTRVNVSSCQLWGLKISNNTWEKMIDAGNGNIQGGVWSEDFSRSINTPSGTYRNESDGTVSMINQNGYAAHFWNGPYNGSNFVYAGTTYRHFIAACSTRLVLANPSQSDDRSSSRYLLNMGADWRTTNGSCPTPPGYSAQVCDSVGVGKFVKVQNNWRRVLLSTLTSNDINSQPLPPNDVFKNPDGTYGNGDTLGGGGGGGLQPISNGTGLDARYFGGLNFNGTNGFERRVDSTVNFNWGLGAPISWFPVNKFSVIWEGYLMPRSTETYRFRTTTDDGIRVYINNNLVINNWTDHGATDNTASVALTAGQRVPVRIEYYENTGNAVMQFYWSSPSLTEQVVPRSQLFPIPLTY